mmetsp:Transcript_246/g.629  ORF Transcript_246/g.629 Transcript_246/m.629 type:complete len:204 (+) Transcript_246:828-1439(+)
MIWWIEAGFRRWTRCWQRWPKASRRLWERGNECGKWRQISGARRRLGWRRRLRQRRRTRERRRQRLWRWRHNRGNSPLTSPPPPPTPRRPLDPRLDVALPPPPLPLHLHLHLLYTYLPPLQTPHLTARTSLAHSSSVPRRMHRFRTPAGRRRYPPPPPGMGCQGCPARCPAAAIRWMRWGHCGARCGGRRARSTLGAGRCPRL